jgi:hypothetical protein
VLKWEGERSDVRTDNERPSSLSVGGGSGGGGVVEMEGVSGREGDSGNGLELEGDSLRMRSLKEDGSRR